MNKLTTYIFFASVLFNHNTLYADSFDPLHAIQQFRDSEQQKAESILGANAKQLADISHQRYTLKGENDSIVIDTVTQLEWMRCSIGQVWENNRCEGQASELDWDDALVLPSLLNRSGGYSGYLDWRLPSLDELRTLVFCSANTPPFKDYEDRCAGGGHQRPTILLEAFPNTHENGFWTMTASDTGTSSARSISFRDGTEYNSSKRIKYNIRLVRGKQIQNNQDL